VSLAPSSIDRGAAGLEALVRGRCDPLAAATNLFKDQLLADRTMTDNGPGQWAAGGIVGDASAW